MTLLYIWLTVKKHKYIIGIVILSSLFFCFCKKRLLQNIELRGRILNFITKTPEKYGGISVMTGSWKVYASNNVNMGSASTYGDGTFYFKSRAAYTNQYQCVISAYGSAINKDIQIEPGQSVDLGDFLVGDFTFFCKVNLVPVTTSAFEIDSFYITEQQPVIWGTHAIAHFNAGTATQFLVRHTASYNPASYNQDANSFKICFSTFPGGVKKDSCITILTHLQPDTLAVTIQY